MTALLGAKGTWYLMRGSGFVALILLTVTVCLGIANLARFAWGPWTRAVAALVHRNVSLLAVAFLGIHVLTAVTDRYVNVPWLSVVVPGASHYDPLWVGIGAVSVDILIAVVVTSLLRSRLRYRAWQIVHWLAYLAWPTAVIHGLGAGSGAGVDTGTTWATVTYLAVALAFAAAVTVRLVTDGRSAPGAPAHPAPRATGRPPAYRRPALAAGSSPVAASAAPTPWRSR